MDMEVFPFSPSAPLQPRNESFMLPPSSSVLCERVFSKARERVSKRGNRLGPNMLPKRLFLEKTKPVNPSLSPQEIHTHTGVDKHFHVLNEFFTTFTLFSHFHFYFLAKRSTSLLLLFSNYGIWNTYTSLS